MGKAILPLAYATVQPGEEIEGFIGDAAQGGAEQTGEGGEVAAEFQVLEKVEEIEHLLAAVEALSLHHVIWNPLPAQLPLVCFQVGETTKQQGDVAEAWLSWGKNSSVFKTFNLSM